MTFFNQARRKRIGISFVLAGVVLLGVALVYMLVWGALEPVVLVAGLFFSIHAGFGEFKIRDELRTRRHWISLIAFVGALTYIVVGVVASQFNDLFVYVLGGAVTLALLRVFLIPEPLSNAERYLFLLVVLMLLVSLVANPINAFGALLIVHVITWTLYGDRQAARFGTRRAYWIETTVLFLIMTGLFSLFAFFRTPIIALLFAPTAYYFWSLAHIFLTPRLSLPFTTHVLPTK